MAIETVLSRQNGPRDDPHSRRRDVASRLGHPYFGRGGGVDSSCHELRGYFKARADCWRWLFPKSKIEKVSSLTGTDHFARAPMR